MVLLSDLISSLPDGEISQLIIGLHRTAVVSEVEDNRCCGLATTLALGHKHHNAADVPNTGKFEKSNSLVVTDIEPVLRAIRQGSYFRQVHIGGVRLVSMARENYRIC